MSPSKITAIIDYAHTPDALENILKTLVSLKKGVRKSSLFLVVVEKGIKVKDH